MRLNKIIQRDYTFFSLYYQIKLPLDLEISIPSDDPVRLVSAFVEGEDLFTGLNSVLFSVLKYRYSEENESVKVC